MQATSLTFVIVAAQIGTASGQITQTTGAALLAAGLLSAALFPATALKMLSADPPAGIRRSEAGSVPAERATTAHPGGPACRNHFA
jgi:hypothetical protein